MEKIRYIELSEKPPTIQEVFFFSFLIKIKQGEKMANLGFFKIDTDGQYKSLSELTGITFIDAEKYIIQVQGGCAVLIESFTTPTEGGFLFNNTTYPIQYEAGSETLYIKTLIGSGGCVINVGD